MVITDAHVIRLIQRIGEHYQGNICNHYIRPALFQLPLEKQVWDQVEILTEKSEQYRYQGFDLEALYRQIIAVAHLVSVAQRDLAPTLRNRLSGGPSSERILREMAVNTFRSNMQLFAEMVHELLVCLMDMDKAAVKGRHPVCTSMPELEEAERRLTSTA